MPHTLVNEVILVGQLVQVSGTIEFSPDEKITEMDMYFVILQGNVGVRGKWTVPAGSKNWVASVPLNGRIIQPGTVSTTGIAVFQTADPGGFETYTWSQNLQCSSVNNQPAEHVA